MVSQAQLRPRSLARFLCSGVALRVEEQAAPHGPSQIDPKEIPAVARKMLVAASAITARSVRSSLSRAPERLPTYKDVLLLI